MAEQQLKVFISHSHEDNAFCRALVQGLQQAGADVWYDEHNLGSGQLMSVIQRELGARPTFIVILSKAAFASRWVKRETTWAFELYDRDPTRILLPVTASAIERGDFSAENEWLFLHDFRRIEAPGLQSFPIDEAVRRTLRALALTPAGETPASTAPQPMESPEDMLERGKALQAQGKHAEAMPLFERATQLAPQSFDAWFNLGYTLYSLERPPQERLDAYERATILDPGNALAWSNKGSALNELQRYEEALAAFEQALNLNPNFRNAWYNKGNALLGMQLYEEAVAAYGRALKLDPSYEIAWSNKGSALNKLQRYEEALAAFEQALNLNPDDANAWGGKAAVLHNLKQYKEALAARDQQLRLEPQNAQDWRYKAGTLRALGEKAAARAAVRRAKELGG